VIVDFKLAFQQYQLSFPGHSDVIPKFASITGFWYTWGWGGTPLIEYFETSCDDRWCNLTDCNTDGHLNYQHRRRDRIEQQIKPILEEYDQKKGDPKEASKIFVQHMEKYDLLKLLPGAVPAFVLRSRKWGKLPFDRPVSCADSSCFSPSGADIVERNEVGRQLERSCPTKRPQEHGTSNG